MSKDQIFGTFRVGLTMRFQAIPSTRGIKSLKKDGPKRSQVRITFRKNFFRPSFFNDFSFLIIFFQEFNPPLDHFWPLIISRAKYNLLALSNLQVNEICPGNLFSNMKRRKKKMRRKLFPCPNSHPFSPYFKLFIEPFSENENKNQIQITEILLK